MAGISGGGSDVGPTGAADLVTQGFNNAQKYASDAFSEAISFLNEITAAANGLQSIPPVNGDLGPVASAVAPYIKPIAPAVPSDLTLNIPDAPPDPILTPITIPNLGAAPQFNVAPPEIDIPAEPVPLTATVPVQPGLNPVIIPSAPDLVLPNVPTLIGINVPAEPLLNLPTFTAVKPDSPLAPAYIFSFAEPLYTSQLLTDLRGILDVWVNGTNTGLSAAVEQAIWDQARTRENVALSRKIKEQIRTYSTRGFSKPPGALATDINAAMQDSNSTLSGLSRDIMIKQADLEQSNRRFAFDQAWKVESGLIEYQNNIAQRAFDGAKFAQQVAIDIYREEVASYAADIQAYATQVEVFKALIQAELSKLDVFRAEIEAQKLIGELNLQNVQIYSTEVEAARTIIDIFKAEVDAANAQANVNKTIIDAFAAQVGAYAETVRAKAAEYEAYATVVRAQVSKADVFRAQADAYTSTVNGFKATVDATVEQTNLAIRVGQEVPLDLFKARTEVFRDVVGAETSRVDAVARVYAAEIGGYSAAVQAESARIGADVSVVKSDTDIAVATGNLRIEAAKTNVQTLIQQTNLLIEAVRAGATVAAQLAAASLSSVNLSGQIGDHFTSSEAISTSDSTSNVTSTNDSTSTTNATSTSTANNSTNSTINSVGTNTNTNFNISN